MPTASEFLDAGKDRGQEAEHKAERSSFSLTCSRLSQYLREKGGFGDLTLGLTFNPDATSGKRDATELRAPGSDAQQQGYDEADGSSLKLFPQHAGFGGSTPFDNTYNPNQSGLVPKEGVSVGSEKMTIFYAGKMMVFEDVAMEKAEAVMKYMGGGTTTRLAPASSYLPLARKASVQRFLETRKDRLSSKAPYKTFHSTPGASMNEKSTGLPVSIGFAAGVSTDSLGFKPYRASPLDSSNQSFASLCSL